MHYAANIITDLQVMTAVSDMLLKIGVNAKWIKEQQHQIKYEAVLHSIAPAGKDRDQKTIISRVESLCSRHHWGPTLCPL